LLPRSEKGTQKKIEANKNDPGNQQGSIPAETDTMSIMHEFLPLTDSILMLITDKYWKILENLWSTRVESD
jgi:hypothetical protein